jgi:hypothetical protein
MGHAYAGSRNITPWQALAEEVRRSAGEVAWLDLKVGGAVDDDELIGQGVLAPWVVKREQQRLHLARVAKMALDAGVAERIVAQLEFEARTIAAVMTRVLDSLHLDDEQLAVARATMRNELLALDRGEGKVIEGDAQ